MIARFRWAHLIRPRFRWIAQQHPTPEMAAPDQPASIAAIVGPKGDPGESFEHVQASPSDAWTVNHNLGFRPSVTVLSPGGVEIAAHVVHASTNQLRVYFAAPQSGAVHCV